MILSYGDRRTERFAAGEFVAAFQGFEQQAAKRLSILNAAPSLDTLRALPSNRLESLRGAERSSTPSESIGNGASASPGPEEIQDRPTLRSWTITRNGGIEHV